MLEQPWPPTAPGPQQPRDAHRQHWANDARRRPPVGTGTPPGVWGEGSAREPAVRRRTDHVGGDGDRPERGAPERGVPDAASTYPARARWVPAEAWIPDPTPAPEQRWTPEQDWLAAFAERREPAAGPPAASRRAAGRWVAAGAAALGLGAALVVALVALL